MGELSTSKLLALVKNWYEEKRQIDYYSSEFPFGPLQSELHLLNCIENGSKVLDIGCGVGRISTYIAQKGNYVTGIDVSKEMIFKAREFAKNMGLDIDYRVTDPLVLPFNESSFDIAVLFKVFCYIPTRTLRESFLSEVYRILKPQGKMLLTQYVVPEDCLADSMDDHFKNMAQFYSDVIEYGDTFPEGRGYVHWFSQESLFDELSNSKFTIEIYENDLAYGGSGLLQLAIMQK